MLCRQEKRRHSAGFRMGNGAPERGFATTLSCIFRGMLPGVMGQNKHHSVPNCVPIGMGHPTPWRYLCTSPTPDLGRRFIYQWNNAFGGLPSIELWWQLVQACYACMITGDQGVVRWHLASWIYPGFICCQRLPARLKTRAIRAAVLGFLTLQVPLSLRGSIW